MKYIEIEYATVKCPDCGRLIPQYMKDIFMTWDTREECPCGYHKDYNHHNPHLGFGERIKR